MRHLLERDRLDTIRNRLDQKKVKKNVLLLTLTITYDNNVSMSVVKTSTPSGGKLMVPRTLGGQVAACFAASGCCSLSQHWNTLKNDCVHKLL